MCCPRWTNHQSEDCSPGLLTTGWVSPPLLPDTSHPNVSPLLNIPSRIYLTGLLYLTPWIALGLSPSWFQLPTSGSSMWQIYCSNWILHWDALKMGSLKPIVPSTHNIVYFETLNNIFQEKWALLQLIHLPFQTSVNFKSLPQFCNDTGWTKFVFKLLCLNLKDHLPFKSRNITGMWVSIPDTGVLKYKTGTMVAFKVTEIYPAHVPDDPKPQDIAFSLQFLARPLITLPNLFILIYCCRFQETQTNWYFSYISPLRIIFFDLCFLKCFLSLKC